MINLTKKIEVIPLDDLKFLSNVDLAIRQNDADIESRLEGNVGNSIDWGKMFIDLIAFAEMQNYSFVQLITTVHNGATAVFRSNSWKV